MIQRAASIWGVPANQIATSFDPLVTMLISACAYELEKISSEVNDSHNRITERLIQLMTPESVAGAIPAYAIVKAMPLDDTQAVNIDYQFLCKKFKAVVGSERISQEVYFSPVDNFVLHNANVKYIVSGNSLREVTALNETETLYSGLTNVSKSTLYLGITSDLKTLPPGDYNFYFEINDLYVREQFFYHLQNARWSEGEQVLQSISGIYSGKEKAKAFKSLVFDGSSEQSSNIRESVIKAANKNYITIKLPAAAKKSKTPIQPPPFVEELIEQKIKIDEVKRWIRIDFSSIVDSKMLSGIYSALNTFPVINTQLHSTSYRLREFVNTIPLKTEDSFFDMRSLENSSGHLYKARIRSSDENVKGSYLIRDDSLGKLDDRKAKEYLIRMIELLKDESAAFSFMGSDFLTKNLKALNQSIALLEDKVNRSETNSDETTYIQVSPYKAKENLIMKYWTTLGDFGNGLTPGTSLSPHKAPGIDREGLILITSTVGGKNRLALNERMKSYRKSLLTRDRIVTQQDVRAVCMEMYGERADEIKVFKAYRTGKGNNQGVEPCICIEVSPNNSKSISPEDWNMVNTNVIGYLEKNSANMFPYEIKVLIS